MDIQYALPCFVRFYNNKSPPVLENSLISLRIYEVRHRLMLLLIDAPLHKAKITKTRLRGETKTFSLVSFFFLSPWSHLRLIYILDFHPPAPPQTHCCSGHKSQTLLYIFDFLTNHFVVLNPAVHEGFRGREIGAHVLRHKEFGAGVDGGERETFCVPGGVNGGITR